MLKNLLGGLFRRTNTIEPPQPVAAAQPMPKAMDETAAQPIDLPPTLGFVSHRPIYDKTQHVVAYEFSVKDLQPDAGRRRAFDRLLIDTLKNMNVFRLLAFRRAFIHLSLDSLNDPMLLELPNEGVIYIVEPAPGASISDLSAERLQVLRAQGLRIAMEPSKLETYVPDANVRSQLLQQLDYLILDFSAVRPGFSTALLTQLPQARWLARTIRTAEEFELCLNAPDTRFTLFHGPYLANPHVRSNSKANHNQGRVLEIMRLLRSNAPTPQIEAQFKLDSLLLFKLMRFVNSPLHGLSRKIQTLEESLLLLGREVLFKWLSLLLFNAESNNGPALALLEKSLIRARFMEQLGAGHANKLESEHLFMTGMFSLLAPLLNIPLADALDTLGLPFTISDALLHQRGLFATPLQLAVACEQGDTERIASLAQVLHMPLEQINNQYMDSMVWAQEVLRDSEVQNDVGTV